MVGDTTGQGDRAETSTRGNSVSMEFVLDGKSAEEFANIMHTYHGIEGPGHFAEIIGKMLWEQRGE